MSSPLRNGSSRRVSQLDEQVSESRTVVTRTTGNSGGVSAEAVETHISALRSGHAGLDRDIKSQRDALLALFSRCERNYTSNSDTLLLLESLRNQVSSLQLEVTQTQQSVRRLQSTIEEKNSYIETLNGSVRSLREEVQQRDVSLRKQAQTEAAKDAKLADQSALLADRQAELQSARASLAASRTRLEETTATIETRDREVQAAASRAEAVARQHSAALDNLKARLSAAEAQAAQREQEASDLRAEIESMRKLHGSTVRSLNRSHEEAMRSARDSYKSSVARRDDVVARLRVHIGHLRKNHLEYEALLQGSRRALAKREGTIAELIEERRVQSETVTKVRQELATSAQQLEEARQALREQEHVVTAGQARVAELTEELAAARRDTRSRESQLEKVQQSLAGQNARVTELSEAIVAKNTALANMKVTIEQMTRTHSELESTISGLRRQLASFEEERASLDTQVRHLQEDLNGSRAEISEAKGSALAREGTLKQIRGQIVVLQDELRFAKEEVEAHKTRLATVEGERDQLAKDLQQAEISLTELRALLATRTEELRVRSTELTQAEGVTGELRSQLESLESRVTQQEEQVTTLRKQLAEKDGELAAARHTIQQQETRITEQTTECQEYTTSIATLQQQLVDLRKKHASVEENVRMLNDELAGKQATVDEQNGRLESQDVAYNKLQDTLQRTITTHTTTVSEMRAEIASLNSRISNLKTQLNSASEQRQSIARLNHGYKQLLQEDAGVAGAAGKSGPASDSAGVSGAAPESSSSTVDYLTMTVASEQLPVRWTLPVPQSGGDDEKGNAGQPLTCGGSQATVLAFWRRDTLRSVSNPLDPKTWSSDQHDKSSVWVPGHPVYAGQTVATVAAGSGASVGGGTVVSAVRFDQPLRLKVPAGALADEEGERDHQQVVKLCVYVNDPLPSAGSVLQETALVGMGEFAVSDLCGRHNSSGTLSAPLSHDYSLHLRTVLQQQSSALVVRGSISSESDCDLPPAGLGKSAGVGASSGQSVARALQWSAVQATAGSYLQEYASFSSYFVRQGVKIYRERILVQYRPPASGSDVTDAGSFVWVAADSYKPGQDMELAGSVDVSEVLQVTTGRQSAVLKSLSQLDDTKCLSVITQNNRRLDLEATGSTDAARWAEALESLLTGARKRAEGGASGPAEDGAGVSGGVESKQGGEGGDGDIDGSTLFDSELSEYKWLNERMHSELQRLRAQASWTAHEAALNGSRQCRVVVDDSAMRRLQAQHFVQLRRELQFLRHSSQAYRRWRALSEHAALKQKLVNDATLILSKMKPQLGCEFQDTEGRLGVRISSVVQGRPAQIDGLLPDDVVISVDGVDTPTIQTFKAQLLKHRPGDRVAFLVKRFPSNYRGPRDDPTRATLAFIRWLVFGAVDYTRHDVSKIVRVARGDVGDDAIASLAKRMAFVDYSPPSTNNNQLLLQLLKEMERIESSSGTPVSGSSLLDARAWGVHYATEVHRLRSDAKAAASVPESISESEVRINQLYAGLENTRTAFRDNLSKLVRDDFGSSSPPPMQARPVEVKSPEPEVVVRAPPQQEEKPQAALAPEPEPEPEPQPEPTPEPTPQPAPEAKAPVRRTPELFTKLLKKQKGMKLMPLRKCVNMILRLYFDRIAEQEAASSNRRSQRTRTTFAQFVYDTLLKQYGLQALAESNLANLLYSIIRYLQLPLAPARLRRKPFSAEEQAKWSRNDLNHLRIFADLVHLYSSHQLPEQACAVMLECLREVQQRCADELPNVKTTSERPQGRRGRRSITAASVQQTSTSSSAKVATLSAISTHVLRLQKKSSKREASGARQTEEERNMHLPLRYCMEAVIQGFYAMRQYESGLDTAINLLEEYSLHKRGGRTFQLSGADTRTLLLKQHLLNMIGGRGTRGNIAAFFEKLDADGSGSVTLDEFSDGLQDMKMGLAPAQIKQLVKSMDVDNDGTIDYAELKEGFKLTTAWLPLSVFLEAVLAGNAVDLQMQGDHFMRVFRAADANNDHKMSFEEFVALVVSEDKSMEMSDIQGMYSAAQELQRSHSALQDSGGSDALTAQTFAIVARDWSLGRGPKILKRAEGWFVSYLRRTRVVSTTTLSESKSASGGMSVTISASAPAASSSSSERVLSSESSGVSSQVQSSAVSDQQSSTVSSEQQSSNSSTTTTTNSTTSSTTTSQNISTVSSSSSGFQFGSGEHSFSSGTVVRSSPSKAGNMPIRATNLLVPTTWVENNDKDKQILEQEQ